MLLCMIAMLKQSFYSNICILQGAPPNDSPTVDTAEQVYISSLALLKMLKHGRAGVPMEVMGLMLGEFVDDYTVRVIDVFAMPQSGTVSTTFHVNIKPF